jgi:hypothetical protein
VGRIAGRPPNRRTGAAVPAQRRTEEINHPQRIPAERGNLAGKIARPISASGFRLEAATPTNKKARLEKRALLLKFPRIKFFPPLLQ